MSRKPFVLDDRNLPGDGGLVGAVVRLGDRVDLSGDALGEGLGLGQERVVA